MSGVKGIAPCGHPGTFVTANFIACDQRCSFNVGESPRATSNPRREPGHVDMCACAPCQIRRRSVSVLLTTKDGLKILLPWNGVDNKITWTPVQGATIRHWALIESNGDDVATGHVDFYLFSGRTAHINIELFMDAAAKAMLTVEQPGYVSKRRMGDIARYDPSKVVVTFNGVELKGCTDATFFECAEPALAKSWTAMTADQIYDDMTTLVQKTYEDPLIEQPDKLLLSGSLIDSLVRVTAERTAELYKLARSLMLDTETEHA